MSHLNTALFNNTQHKIYFGKYFSIKKLYLFFRSLRQLRQRQSWYFESMNACTSDPNTMLLQSQRVMLPALHPNSWLHRGQLFCSCNGIARNFKNCSYRIICKMRSLVTEFLLKL